MKIAVVYNRDSQKVINLFGMPNREKYGLKAIKRITDALRDAGRQVIALEGDKDLIDRLGEFMPRVLKGERPGMVFNLSYGIQGQARYTHVPGILEMVGIPYVGSGPLAHSLALDKVVAKMIFKQRGLPTPDFAVLDGPDFPMPDLAFPLIVKPKNEAVSFGIKIVNDEGELREGAQAIFDKFQQPVLVEQYIEGREVNVGLIGNNPPTAFPPAELSFGEGGPNIYTFEDKTRTSGREIGVVCPAKLDAEATRRVQDIALKAFAELGCNDCARVDLRMDKDGNFYILEINSLPSLGEHGSYVAAAEAVGLDFPKLVNRLVDEASARYFGTPRPPEVSSTRRDPASTVFSYLTASRDRMEQRVREWVKRTSRTSDPVGIRTAVQELGGRLTDLGLVARADLTNDLSAWTWQTKKGLDGGTLLIGNVDVPISESLPHQPFRRDPERLHGEGIASSRAPIVMLEYTLRALRHARKLHRLPLGVLMVSDEGRDCRYSAELIREAAKKASRVLVLRPGNPDCSTINQRRGRRKYRFTAEGRPRRPGYSGKQPEVFTWASEKLQALCSLSSRKKLLSVSVADFKTINYPMLLPHRVEATVLVTYLDESDADRVEEEAQKKLRQEGFRRDINLISDRPPMKDRPVNRTLFKELAACARALEIPLERDSSVWPSAAGWVPAKTPVLCGLGPVGLNLSTPDECVDRISLMQRTLLLATFLAKGATS